VDASLQEIRARKQQVISQMKDRYQNRIVSNLQSLRLQHDKVKTQIKIDNDRMLQAQRDEIKAKLESKYLKLENETRVKHFRAIKEMNTVEIERLKIDK
jgi:hypothetical protein